MIDEKSCSDKSSDIHSRSDSSLCYSVERAKYAKKSLVRRTLKLLSTVGSSLSELSIACCRGSFGTHSSVVHTHNNTWKSAHSSTISLFCRISEISTLRRAALRATRVSLSRVSA